MPQKPSKIWNPRLVHAVQEDKIDSILREPHPFLYTLPIFTPSFCGYLIRAAEEHGGFAPVEGDPAPGREIRLAQFLSREDYYDLLQGFVDYLRPVIDHCYGLEMEFSWSPFVVKYTLDSQTSMTEHVDEQSDVSLSVPLNKDFTGGNLHFPKFDYSPGLPKGVGILFPGKTMRHSAKEIESGTRYSLTWWMTGNPCWIHDRHGRTLENLGV